ncbi:MAG: alpha/beta fold hydrolase [Acidimicrobiales bacterium]
MHEAWLSLEGGVRLHLLRWDGDPGAVPFLLVHGLSSNARLWAGVGDQLAGGGHPVVAVDLRGHGRSAKPESGYDRATVSDDLAVLIADLPLDRPVVAGQSWGGNVVLELAARHPDAVRGVACVDGGWIEPSRQFPDWDDCVRRLAPPTLDGTPVATMRDRLRALHPDWPDAALGATMANFELREDGTVSPWLTRSRHVAIVRDLWEGHPPAVYPDVHAPVLLMPVDTGAPALDRVREEVATAEMLLPVSRTAWLSGDHDVHAEQPDAVAALLGGACLDGFFP